MVRPELLDEDAIWNSYGACRVRPWPRRCPRPGSAARGAAGTPSSWWTRSCEQAEEYAERYALEHEQRAVLAELGLPLHELPLLAEGMDLAGLYELATELRKQGMS